jgi:Tfp pilus assembly protein PilN
MIEINLIPDVKQELIKAQSVRATVISSSIIASIVAVGIVVLLSLYVFGGQALRSGASDGEIDKKGAELAAVEDLSEMLTLQNQLKVISDLQENKNIHSRTFDMLAAVIPPSPNEARISQLSIDSDMSTVRLEGQTRSFDSMETFKKTIDAAVLVYKLDDEEVQIKLAEDISTGDTSFGEDADGNKTFRFVLSFVYPLELYSSDITNVTFKLVVNGNVTDSYLGIPKTIFTEAAQDLEGEQ